MSICSENGGTCEMLSRDGDLICLGFDWVKKEENGGRRSVCWCRFDCRKVVELIHGGEGFKVNENEKRKSRFFFKNHDMLLCTHSYQKYMGVYLLKNWKLKKKPKLHERVLLMHGHVFQNFEGKLRKSIFGVSKVQQLKIEKPLAFCLK